MNFLNKSTGASEQANGHCQARTLSGGPCRALPLHGGSLCVFHSPGARERVREGNRLGGLRTARRLRASDLAALDLARPEEALSQVAEALIRGSINEGVARELRGLIRARVDIFDLREVNARLDALEAAKNGR